MKLNSMHIMFEVRNIFKNLFMQKGYKNVVAYFVGIEGTF